MIAGNVTRCQRQLSSRSEMAERGTIEEEFRDAVSEMARRSGELR
jgi:hypothetical protein